MSLEIGQELWWVPADSRFVAKQSRAVRVTKVGRKWATLDNHERIDINSLWADGGNYSSAGRCWPSHQDWVSEQRRCAAWERLRQMVDGFGTPEISEATIMEAVCDGAEMIPKEVSDIADFIYAEWRNYMNDGDTGAEVLKAAWRIYNAGYRKAAQ